MLRLYYGNTQGPVRATMQQEVLHTASPEVEVVYLEADRFVAGQVVEAVHGTSLFNASYIYVLDTPSENAEFATEVQTNLDSLAAATDQFIVLENKLTAAEKKIYAKYTDDIKDCSVAVAKRPDAFAMTDSLCQRNKRRLWLELQTVRWNGLTAEEIIGTLWWQLKTLRLAAITTSATEAGLKEYPYKKAKQALSKYSLPEIETLSKKLLQVYHDGHGGMRDIDLALEEWVLTV